LRHFILQSHHNIPCRLTLRLIFVFRDEENLSFRYASIVRQELQKIVEKITYVSEIRKFDKSGNLPDLTRIEQGESV